MLLVRSPLRISLGGGGTDLPSLFRGRGTSFCSAAIDKYVYLTISKPFDSKILLRYSKYEEVSRIRDIEHPIIREALKLLCPNVEALEIASFADIPSGTGLGSSGSFTTALVKALNLYFHRSSNANEIARLATYLEAEILGEPVGIQDQYISAFGGITSFEVDGDSNIRVESLKISRETLQDLETNLCLFYTGKSRSASVILADQDLRSRASENQIIEELNEIKEMGLLVREALELGKLDKFGRLLDEHWQLKRSRSQGISSEFIDEIYKAGIKSGALGGKLVGAGGGGFVLFYTEDVVKLRKTMSDLGLEELRFKFDFEGTKAIFS